MAAIPEVHHAAKPLHSALTNAGVDQGTGSRGISRQLPTTLADVALIDAELCAAAGTMSVSWWSEEVRAGRAPKPVVQRPRCTRWRMADVKAFWIEFATAGAKDTVPGAVMKAKLANASSTARAMRAAEVSQ